MSSSFAKLTRILSDWQPPTQSFLGVLHAFLPQPLRREIYKKPTLISLLHSCQEHVTERSQTVLRPNNLRTLKYPTICIYHGESITFSLLMSRPEHSCLQSFLYPQMAGGSAGLEEQTSLRTRISPLMLVTLLGQIKPSKSEQSSD